MNVKKYKNIIEVLWEEMGKPLKIFFAVFFLVFLTIGWFTILLNTNSQSASVFGREKNTKEKILNERSNHIVIPKIEAEAPLFFVDSKEPRDFKEPLKKGVTHFPSALPGEKGETIILGHSAPPGWPKRNFNWIFSEISMLNPGDEIYIYFNNRQYQYEVTGKIFLERGEDLPSSYPENLNSSLTLISCWPPGIDNKRIAVQAVLKN